MTPRLVRLRRVGFPADTRRGSHVRYLGPVEPVRSFGVLLRLRLTRVGLVERRTARWLWVRPVAS